MVRDVLWSFILMTLYIYTSSGYEAWLTTVSSVFQEREFRQIKLLPDILILQKRLVRKFQNASDQIVGSIREFIEKQTGTTVTSMINETQLYEYTLWWACPNVKFVP